MPQPTVRPWDSRVTKGPLEPISRELPADRPRWIPAHRKHEGASDRGVLRAKVEQRLLRLLRHRNHPRLALFVVLGPPADRLLLEVKVVPLEVDHASETPAGCIHQ